MVEHISRFKIVLASKSPRRKQILEEGGFNFRTLSIDADESFPDSINAEQVAEFVAQKKSDSVEIALRHDEILLTCDTTVVLGDEILNKPKDKKHAVEMLEKLSGKEHKVISGVCMKTNEHTLSFSDVTTVTFKNLSKNEILYYVDQYKPFDKAGAYGIQEWIGSVAIQKINGSYLNVVGLPINKIYEKIISL